MSPSPPKTRPPCPSLPIRLHMRRAPPPPSMTRRAIHASFTHPAAVRLLVTNRLPPSTIPLHSTGISPNPTYDRLQLNLLPTTPYQTQSRAISSNSGGLNTVEASNTASPPPYRLRVQRPFRPIEGPARPAQPPVLVGSWSPEGTFVRNRYRK
jgi:hypothetical protein